MNHEPLLKFAKIFLKKESWKYSRLVLFEVWNVCYMSYSNLTNLSAKISHTNTFYHTGGGRENYVCRHLRSTGGLKFFQTFWQCYTVTGKGGSSSIASIRPNIPEAWGTRSRRKKWTCISWLMFLKFLPVDFELCFL